MFDNLCAHILLLVYLSDRQYINFQQLPDNVGAQVLTVLAEVLVQADVTCQVLVIRIHLNLIFLRLEGWRFI